MNCFYHPKSNSYGICKHCYKALCKKCISQYKGQIACKEDICREKLRLIDKLNDKVFHLYGLKNKKPKFRYITSILLILVGALMLFSGIILIKEEGIIGIYEIRALAVLGLTYTALGFWFILFSFYTIYRIKKYDI